MTIDLYISNSQKNVLDKDLKLIKTISNARPFNSISILTPSLLTDYDADLLQCNYMYIRDFNRYYYTTIGLDTASSLTLTGTVDALMTYKAAILNANATVTRNSGIGKPTYIIDSQYPISPDSIYINAVDFPYQPYASIPINGRHIVLEVRN